MFKEHTIARVSERLDDIRFAAVEISTNGDIVLTPPIGGWPATTGTLWITISVIFRTV
jgi:hypothetical protein